MNENLGVRWPTDQRTLPYGSGPGVPYLMSFIRLETERAKAPNP